MEDDRFSILFVCTGNQCRSALAAVITRSLSYGLPVDVSSAGTLTLPPTPSPRETVAAASTLGYDLQRHRSAPVAGVDAGSFDLVIGFELPHVAAAVVDRGADRRKTFLFRQLIDLLEQLPVQGEGDPVAIARARVEEAAERGGTTPPGPADALVDPMGRPARIHLETARTIERLCKALVAELFGRRA